MPYCDVELIIILILIILVLFMCHEIISFMNTSFFPSNLTEDQKFKRRKY